jgi:hypothetical protein
MAKRKIPLSLNDIRFSWQIIFEYLNSFKTLTLVQKSWNRSLFQRTIIRPCSLGVWLRTFQNLHSLIFDWPELKLIEWQPFLMELKIVMLRITFLPHDSFKFKYFVLDLSSIQCVHVEILNSRVNIIYPYSMKRLHLSENYCTRRLERPFIELVCMNLKSLVVEWIDDQTIDNYLINNVWEKCPALECLSITNRGNRVRMNRREHEFLGRNIFCNRA